MILLNPDLIKLEPTILSRIDKESRSIYRAITFCKKTSSKSLLDAFINSTNSLTDLLSIRNAQMEAESKDEIEVYHRNLKKAILYIVNEIKNNRSFDSQLQLFQLFRLISPESHSLHPNRYRDTLVQIGAHLCPSPEQLNNLVTELFYNLELIEHPLIKAIYLHHELIRIHPFADGNGRITRIAKNWILMFNLYPPIFVKDSSEKTEYVNSLSNSFKALILSPERWQPATQLFFKQELDRVLNSINYIHNKISV